VTTLYGIRTCDTVRNAKRWLNDQSIPCQFHDFRSDGLSEALIKHWLKQCDWKQLLNRRSTTWRQLDAQQTADMGQEQAIKLMAKHPTLIKRPVLEHRQRIHIGFKAEQYRSIFDESAIKQPSTSELD